MNDSSIFLDYNATTPVDPVVVEAMQPYWHEQFGNASSRHSMGQTSWRSIERARVQVAALTGSQPDDVIFTSGATESNFLALLGRFEHLVSSGRTPGSIRAAISAIEHPCVMACAEKLRQRGAQVDFVPVDERCLVDVSYFHNQPAYDLVSVMTANHETGVIQPVAEITKAAKEKNPNLFVHTDAAQWAGRIELPFPQDIAAISLSAHKLYGPKGIGALILRNGNEITPLFKGSQEAGFRAGTVNVPGAAGFGKAAELMMGDREAEEKRLAVLCNELVNTLSLLKIKTIQTITHTQRLPQTLHIRFEGMKGERVADALDRLGLCCSPGPACASGASEASPVLLAMGLSEKEAWEGVRFSLGKFSTLEEIKKAGQILHDFQKLVISKQSS